MHLIKIEKRQLRVRPIEWLKLNFASCVVHQTRSLDVLMLHLFYNMVIVNRYFPGVQCSVRIVCRPNYFLFPFFNVLCRIRDIFQLSNQVDSLS